MPELPEVECVRTVLEPLLCGRKICTVTVNLPKVTANRQPDEFKAILTGQTITKLTRRGKYLTIHYQSGDYTVVHLRMTGTLTIEPGTQTRQKHTNLAFLLDNQQELRFVDSRGFGKWWLFHPQDSDTSGQQKLGCEPDQVTVSYLQSQFRNRHVALKKLLLDQTIVAGIGNIYADEICFRSGILPTRPVNELQNADYHALCQNIPAIIQFFVQKHRVPFAVYAASQGTSYQTSTDLCVYGRAGQPCTKCHQPLTRAVLGGRSTVFCTRCQH